MWLVLYALLTKLNKLNGFDSCDCCSAEHKLFDSCDNSLHSACKVLYIQSNDCFEFSKFLISFVIFPDKGISNFGRGLNVENCLL